MKTIAFTIVLNGMPFIKEQYNVLPLVFDEWHIIEGAVVPIKDTSWCRNINEQFYTKNKLSVDGTTEFIDSIVDNKKIFVHRKNNFWQGKLEMCQQIDHLLSNNIVMQFDVDEIWSKQTLLEVLEYAKTMEEADGMLFKCNYYVGPDLITVGENCYGNNPNEWCRLWKPKPNSKWISHEPPRISNCNKFLSRSFTLNKNWIFDHYAYALESQLEFKENFYGYAGAVNYWKTLQRADKDKFPTKLNQYLPWVDGNAVVTKLHKPKKLSNLPKSSNNLVLISHYNTDINWLDELKVPYIIYSKTLKTANGYIDFNKGQEVPMYLKYIIDHYENLPDRTLFYHDHLNSPHQDFDSINLINNVNWELDDYFSVNKRSWYQTINKNSTVEPLGLQWVHDCWFLFEKYLPFTNKLTFFTGAQFVIKKELILQYEKAYYEYLYEWIKTTTVSNYITSRVFEYMWHYIFTKNNVETFYKNVLM